MSPFLRVVRARVLPGIGQFPLALRYAAAVGTVALATVLRFAVRSTLQNDALFLPYLLATILSAWLFGAGPAGLATVLGAVCAEVFFVVPTDRGVFDAAQLIQICLYSACCLLCILTVLVLHRTSVYATRSEVAAERGQAELRRAAERWDQAQENLRENQAWLLLAERSAQLGSWSRDLNSGRMAYSDSLEDILGGKPASGVSPGDVVFPGVHPEDVERLHETVLAAIREGREYEVEYRIQRPDGAIRWMSERGHASIDPQKSTRQLSGVTMDITERKQSEERARELRASLMQFQLNETKRVEDELGRVRDQLVQQTRLAAIGQLSASIAHDLRNPLGVIRNAAYLLRQRLSKSSENLDLLSMIEDEVRASDAIITNLMEMTRGREPRCSETELGAMIREVTRRLDSTSRIKWQVDLKPSPFVAWVDPGQFRQVLQNLLQNAVEAMKGRGAVSVAGWRNGDSDILEVRDTGPGISEEIRPRLFEPLVTSKKTGTGLGLMLCRQIVKRHGGEITVGEASGPGATFRIRLPRPVSVRPTGSGN